MTSGSLFFRLVKEDMKRRLWAFGLSFLTFFFTMPVVAAMGITSLEQQYARWVKEAGNYYFGEGVTAEMERAERLRELVTEVVGLDHGLMCLIVSTAAMVLALTGFLYLHSRKQVDFYHSIPVRREVLFGVRYLGGILIVASMYLVNLLFALGVFGAEGALEPGMVSGAFQAFLVHMTGFLLVYGLMTIAVLLTGNFFVSILGGIVLFSYIPAIVSLVQGMMYMFFATMDGRISVFSDWVSKGSPLSCYVMLVDEGMRLPMDQYGTVAGHTVPALLAAVLLAAAAAVLYRLRPSEAAGKAMAFPVTKAAIKILMAVPITILVSLLFWNTYYSFGWTAFGFIISLALSSGIIEIIYNFDFRKLFANPAHMGVSAVLALAVLAVFRYDLAGYDTWLPKEDEFQSASVYAYGLDDFRDYGLPVKEEDGYSWEYMNGEDYAAGNMELTDYGLVSSLARAGIENALEEKEARFKNQSTEREGGYWTYMEVGFRKKDGSVAYRSYHLDITEMREIIDQIYTSKEYKTGMYPVMAFEAENLTGIYESVGQGVLEVTKEPDQIAAILSAYQEELAALTLGEREKTAPVTALRFLTRAEEEYLQTVTRTRTSGYDGSFRMGDMDSQVNFFPVYPSFTKTLGLLREAGVRPGLPFTLEDVDRIEIESHYWPETAVSGDEDKETEGMTRTLENVAVAYPEMEGSRRIVIQADGSAAAEAQIREVLENGVPVWMFQLNSLCPREDGISAYVYLKPGIETMGMESPREIKFYPCQIPGFLMEETGYDCENAARASWGLGGKKD